MGKIIKLNKLSGGRNNVSVTEHYVNSDYIIRFWNDNEDVKFWGRTCTVVQIMKGDLALGISVTDTCEEIMRMVNGE